MTGGTPTPRTLVDRGGTFTDVVTLTVDGDVTVRKVPSDAAVVGDLAQGPLTVGTTVATNALLERAGARTLLLVTAGFEDLPWIGDQARPAIFDSDLTVAPPLCDRVVGVEGRVDARGRELAPLEVPTLDLSDVDSVAVVLINSHQNPSHELALRDALGEACFVSLGHQVSPEVGYLARIETTLVDAAITPVLQRAMRQDAIPVGARAIRSDGSLCLASRLRAPDAVLSGPAGGVLAVAAITRMAGFPAAVGLDMGGTSTDVCRVDAADHLGPPRREGDVRVAGVRLRRPMFEVETIAAGGGSVLGHDGLRLTVGPTSAGASPGPQCYGRGGPPTLTDAALAMGLLDPEAFNPPLDRSAVQLPGEPEAFVEIAQEAMAQAVRRIATARGVDLRDHALVAYGGAAGQHAAGVAERLGIGTVLVHPCAAVLCAWGQALAREEETMVQPVWRPLEAAWDEVLATWASMATQLPALDETRRSVELRHLGTDHALEISLDAETLQSPDRGIAAAREAFEALHRRRYGFDRPGVTVEVVNVRLRVRGATPDPPAVDADPWSVGAGVVHGPQRLDTPITSVYVPAGWTAARKGALLWLTRDGDLTPAASPTQRTPFGVALWSGRFMAVAEEAGSLLQRVARSVNIRERLDFSCAIFDGRGRLVANAPHIPVHLGAMGETVRDLLRRDPAPEDGQAWLSNDPRAGGSHLPDLTVVTAVSAGAHRWFVASRAHHVDVGGLTPGSMPPHSRSLTDEGFIVRQLPLLRDGRLVDLKDLLTGCRDPDTVRADLEAQIAANHHAASALRQLDTPAVIDAWMTHLFEISRAFVAARIGTLSDGEADDVIDGVPLRLTLRTVPHEGDARRLVVDLAGTGGPHAGNLNSPPAVVRAAVLYGLRVLVGRPIPLNEGALSAVEIRTPSPSIVAPPPDAAVVGGNVETSQRLVDLFLRAAGARAASQGTMNNLTLGGSSWSLYETIGGGLGASRTGPGVSGRQVHMTNTRATDVEVLEARLPVQVEAFRYRRRSGGAGRHRGGDGLTRILRVTAPATASLLATRRREGAPGLDGGEAGEPGRDARRRGGRWRPWGGEPIDLDPGDAVRVDTPGGGGFGPPEETP